MGHSRTDRAIAAITAELARHRTLIDAESGLVSIGLVLKFNAKTGMPFRVLFRPETEAALEDLPRVLDTV